MGQSFQQRVTMEINEDHLRSQSYSFRACSSDGAGHCHFHLADRQAGEGESFIVKSGEALHLPCALIVGCWHGSAVGGLRSGVSVCLVKGAHLAFPGWSYVGNGGEN